ncbi:MAG: nuclease A inhibitor family protein [Cyanobacteria bacterium P01_C01_bin.72]
MAGKNIGSFATNPDVELIHKLQTAIENLLWFSEAEYPWQIYYWHDANIFSENILRQQNGYGTSTKIAVQELNAFFAPATRQEAWHNEAEQIEVRRYLALVDLLKTSLSNLRVYWLGDVEFDIYVVGETSHRAIAGLVTKAVAT